MFQISYLIVTSQSADFLKVILKIQLLIENTFFYLRFLAPISLAFYLIKIIIKTLKTFKQSEKKIRFSLKFKSLLFTSKITGQRPPTPKSLFSGTKFTQKSNKF